MIKKLKSELKSKVDKRSTALRSSKEVISKETSFEDGEPAVAVGAQIMCSIHPTEVITFLNPTQKRFMCHKCLDECDRAKDDGNHHPVSSEQISEKAYALIKELQQ